MSFGINPTEAQVDKFWEYVQAFATESSELKFRELVKSRQAEIPESEREKIFEKFKSDVIDFIEDMRP